MIHSSMRTLNDQFESNLLSRETIISLEPRSHKINGNRIYKAELSSGKKVAIKTFEADSDELAIESMNCEVEAIRYFSQMGCAVPDYIADSPMIKSMMTSWSGDHNLHQVLSSNEKHHITSQEVIRSIMSIEVTCLITPNMSSINHHSGTRAEELIRSQLRQRDLSYLPVYIDGAKKLNPTANTSALTDAIISVLNIVNTGIWTYGSMDCKASNIVMRNDRATLIDFSMLGPDWIEKRLCSYCLSPSTKKHEPMFLSAFSKASYTMYDEIMAQWDINYPSESMLDVHFILALLSAASRLEDRHQLQSGYKCPSQSMLKSILQLLLSQTNSSPADAIRTAIS